MADSAVGGFTGCVPVDKHLAGSVYNFTCVWTRSGGGIFRGVAPETVRVRKSVSTDIRKGIDIRKSISGNKIDEAGAGVAANTVVIIACIQVQRDTGAAGLAIQQYSRQTARIAMSGLAPCFSLLPAVGGVMGVVAIATVSSVGAGNIITTQAGTEVSETGCAAGRNAVSGNNR